MFIIARPQGRNPYNKEDRQMKNYETPIVEIVALSDEDVIATSITIELPWLPLMDESELM